MEVGRLNATIDVDTSPLNRGLRQAGASLDGFERKVESTGGVLVGMKTRMAGFAASARAAAVPLAAAGVALSFGLRKAFAAADAFNASQAKLAAAAKITGQNLGFLQTTARQVADQFKTSTTQATELTISMGKLTSRAGESAKTLPALAAFLDLAASNGMSAAQAVDALNLTLIGQDEGLNRLGLRNPQQIYNDWAKAAGLSAAKMTEAQKAQAIMNEVMSKGGKVAGEYAKWLQSPAGRAAALQAETEQASAGIGKALGGMRVVAIDVMSTFTGVVKAAAIAIPKLVLTIARGFLLIPEYLVKAVGIAMESLGGLIGKVSEGLFQISGGRINIGQGLATSLEMGGREAIRKAEAFGEKVGRNYKSKIEQITNDVNLATAITGDTSPLDTLIEKLGDTKAAAGNAATELQKLTEEAQAGFLSLSDQFQIGEAIQDLKTFGSHLADLANVKMPHLAGPSTRTYNAKTGRFGDSAINAAATERLVLDKQPTQAQPGPTFGMRAKAAMSTVQGAAGGVLDSLASSGMELLNVFNPLAIIGTMFKGALEALAPTIDALRPAVEVVAKVFGAALAPIIKALFPVFKLTAIGATYVGQVFFTVAGWILKGVGVLVEGLGRFVDSIVPDWISKAGKGLAKAGQGLQDIGKGFSEGADALAEGREEIRGLKFDELAGATDRLTESMTNAVQGFKVAAYRYRATTGQPASSMGGGGASAGLISPPSAPVTVNGMSMPVTIQAAPGDDGAELYRKQYREMEKQAASNPSFRPIFALYPVPA
jgi:hypothetical protein